MLQSLITAIAFFMLMLIFAIAFANFKYKKGRIITPTYCMVIGTFFASSIIMFPIYYGSFSADGGFVRVFKTVILSIHHAIRLFVVDSDFEIINEAAKTLEAPISGAYSAFAAMLFIIAPILTCNFILSLFKNLLSYERFMLGFFKNTYVFSELNEKSLALAESIRENEKALLIFTDVFRKNEETSFELAERAKELGAILFKSDITSVNFKLHSPASKLVFFTIGENESENIKQSIEIIEKYDKRKKTTLYVFSASVQSELMLCGSIGKLKISKLSECEKQSSCITVHRINDARSLVYRTLYDMELQAIAELSQQGTTASDLFSSAKPAEDGVKRIGAVVVGCGLHGTEMVKTLSWFCQMDGYRITIDAFDREENTKSRFEAEFPELMHPDYNGKYITGEAQYHITVHPRTDTETVEFKNKIKELCDTTYVFVSLGSDEANIKTAVKLRSLFENMGISPIIQSVVYNSEMKRALENARSFSGEEYNIDFIGDLKALYSERVIMDSALEREGLKRHMGYVKSKIENGNLELRERLVSEREKGENDYSDEKIKELCTFSDKEIEKMLLHGEESFRLFEYNYRSSVASALHEKARIACRIPGADKADSLLSEQEREIIGRLEHRRWNAYMRSEGYVRADKRNHLAKTHVDLVSYAKLDEEERRKDSRLGND